MSDTRVPMSRFDKNGSGYLVPGLFIEVLWDIEQIREVGRRAGERSIKSEWWRAEVLRTKEVDGKCAVQLRYESREGFSEQLGEVWVFPNHIRPIDDGDTQLRWRYYECSGDVTYDIDRDPGDSTFNGITGNDCDSCLSQMRSLQHDVGQLMQQNEMLERMVVAQGQLFNRLIGTGSTGDRQCAKIFAILRQKLGVLMQRQIPPARNRRDDDQNRTFFELNCAGCISADVDCDLNTFQAIARVAKSKVTTTCFHPSFIDTQYPPGDVDEAMIMFLSLGDLAQVMEMTSFSDLVCMAFRERGNSAGRENASTDGAIRVLGSCIMDKDDDNSPTATFLGQSLNEDNLSETFDVFFRESHNFDFATRMYTHKLARKNISGDKLIRTVFSSSISNLSEDKQEGAMRDICGEFPKFCLRWHPITPPNSRVWTRALAVSEVVNGILEVELPFLIFRGAEVLQELRKLEVSDCMKHEVHRQLSRYQNF